MILLLRLLRNIQQGMDGFAGLGLNVIPSNLLHYVMLPDTDMQRL
jgi:hypothetical protein